MEEWFSGKYNFPVFRRKVGGTNPKGQTNPKCLNARLTESESRLSETEFFNDLLILPVY